MKTISIMTTALCLIAGAANAETAKPQNVDTGTSTAAVSTSKTSIAVESVREVSQPTSYDFDDYGDSRLNSNG